MFYDPNPGRCPGLSHCAPLGLGRGTKKRDTHFCCQRTPTFVASGHPLLLPAGRNNEWVSAIGSRESASSHPAPCQKDVRRRDRGQRPTATKDPKTKPRRRQLKKRDTMRTTRTPPALPQHGLDRWMIFWTIVHMVLFGYFCGLSARVLAVFWLDGITFCGLFRYWRLDACVVSPAGRYLPAVPAHLS